MQVTAEAHVAEITDPGHEKIVPTIATFVALERSVSNEFRLTLNANNYKITSHCHNDEEIKKGMTFKKVQFFPF